MVLVNFIYRKQKQILCQPEYYKKNHKNRDIRVCLFLDSKNMSDYDLSILTLFVNCQVLTKGLQYLILVMGINVDNTALMH
jgi:hypothetical protein